MSKRLKTGIITLFIIGTVGLSALGGCGLLPSPVPPVATTTTPAGELDIRLLEEAYQLIQKEYVEPDKLDVQKLSDAILKGLVQGVGDPYSAYLTKEEYKLTSSDFAGQFEGIGAYVGSENGMVTVIAPIPGTPAEKAGIKSGDIFLEVDGKSTKGMSVNEVVLLIRGPKGTTVTLKILHKGETQPVTLEIARAQIQVQSVILEMKDGYAHITITNFSERTDEELTPVLQQITQNRATGIILDLRHNPGGYLSTVVNVASHFLDKGTVVSVADRTGAIQDTYTVNRLASKITLPMVTLVDNYSASGSEVLSGALQDYKRSTIAGQKTYGKGSVDQLFQLSDGSGIYLTIARWLTPNGNLIEGKGIQPDVEVDFEQVDGVQWAIDYLNGQK